jgi:hypothetical protein
VCVAKISEIIFNFSYLTPSQRSVLLEKLILAQLINNKFPASF